MADVRIDFEIGANIDMLRKQLRTVGSDYDKISNLVENISKQMDQSAKQKGFSKEFENASAYAKQLSKYVKEIATTGKAVTLSQQTAAAGGINQMASLYKGAAQEALRSGVEAPDPTANLVRARYALYDVANEARRTALLMGGIGVAAIKVGADFEKAFVNVQRTSGATGVALDNLRQSLIEISQTTPIAFQDISAIATLGAQMGIAASGLDEFASTVAKFSAVTGVPVDTVATAVGRISELLNVTASEYENLAASILYAGRNAIATEEQILALTSQIAASAQQAGFAASETVGLATALASLGIAPEQARGVILRLFADFDRVVAAGGDQLDYFASLLGMTGEKVADLWKNRPVEFFTSFTGALAKTENGALGTAGALAALGIVETREINVLQRLSANQGLLLQSLDDASRSYKEGTDLANQYGMTAETLSAKIEKLNNNILAAAAAIGGTLGEAIKPIIDGLSSLLKAIADNPVASTIGAITIVLAAGAAVWLLYKGVVAQAIASIFAMRVAMQELGVEANGLKINMAGLMAELRAVSGSFAVAGTSSRKMAADFAAAGAGTTTLKATLMAMLPQLTIAVGAMAAFNVINKITEASSADLEKQLKLTGQQVQNFAVNAKSVSDQIDLLSRSEVTGDFGMSNLVASVRQIDLSAFNPLAGIADMVTSNNTAWSKAKEEIRTLDEALTSLLGEGKTEQANKIFGEITAQLIEAGYTVERIKELFPEYYNQLNQTANAVSNMSDAEVEATQSSEDFAKVIKDRLISSLTGITSKQAEFSDSLYGFISALKESEGSVDSFSQSGNKALKAFNGFVSAIADFNGTNTAGTISMVAAAINLIESSGGNAGYQVQGLVARINEMFGLNLSGSTITSIAQLQAIIASTGTITAATRAQINALLTGGGYTQAIKDAFKEVNKQVGSTTSNVRKQIRTISSYASEISGLFSNIIDRAFGLQTATDGMAGGWVDLKNRIADAKSEIEDINNEIKDLEADRGTLQYQLTIAEKYGDTVRAAKIRAQLAKLDKELTKRGDELTKARENSSTSLKDNTEAARENRQALIEQVSEAGKLIEAYATTVQENGKLPTAAQVKSYASTVAKGFADQAKEIGFSAEELSNYTKIIEGFGRAAASVAKPNVKVTLDPVTTAITEYLAKKKETEVSIKPNTTGFSAALETALQKIILGSFQIKTGVLPPSPSDLYKTRDTYKKGSSMWMYYDELAKEALKAKMVENGTSGYVPYRYKLADGGFVSGAGTTTSDSIPAMLSNGEYVIKAAAVGRYGLDFMNSLNQMRVGIQPGYSGAAAQAGSGSSVVYLSPEDRALLRAAVDRPINLYTENTKIAQSANAGNVVLAQRGSN